ncbi:MAG: UDP-N-acetylmuramate dehydrogenase [Alphaproteobacteria bacterium]|nr:UDP-N-acetylmuramate dehydrogenase [Alphaproteobacteria bacterium]
MSSSIIDSLPIVRGVLQRNFPLSKKSWFGVGGPAEVLFTPEDIDDLVFFLRNTPENIRITILGAISNVLIRDGGIDGVVILLGDTFKKIYVEDDIIEVGAGVNCTRLATVAMDAELGGLEFLMGLPGTVGGALKMNAGCYGSEISDFLIEFEAVTTSGQIKWFTKKDIKFEYRKSSISDDLIVTRAWFKTSSQVNYSILKKVNSIIEKRKQSQPLNKRSCGSTFKNPTGKRAWELIEKAGGRGMRVGGATVSEKHCNFIINDANATASDIETLGEKIAQKVFETSGIRLEWEVIRLGRKK